MQYLVTKQISHAIDKTGKTIPFTDNTTITITSPSELGSDVNENSLAFVLTYGSQKFFFPGDCETCDADADADVVKLAHHGSRGAVTRELLSRTKPETAIISVGDEKNLPASSTIKALEKAGVAIHRTDQEGTLILHSDGSQYWFE